MKWVWGVAAILAVLALFVLVWWQGQGQAQKSGYLYDMPDAAAEAGYCLAVVERVREITHGQGERKLEAFIDEQMQVWRGRVKGAASVGRAALARDAAAPGVNEGAHLHLAIQDCGLRALRFYGAKFPSMQE